MLKKRLVSIGNCLWFESSFCGGLDPYFKNVKFTKVYFIFGIEHRELEQVVRREPGWLSSIRVCETADKRPCIRSFQHFNRPKQPAEHFRPGGQVNNWPHQIKVRATNHQVLGYADRGDTSTDRP